MSSVILELTNEQYSLLQLAICEASVTNAVNNTPLSLQMAQEYANLGSNIRTQHLRGERFLKQAQSIINPNNPKP